MRKVDQGVRAKVFSSAAAEREFAPELQKTDARLTQQLEKIVAKQGWPTIGLVGIEASQAAALILLHSPDHKFQRQLLPELETLVRKKKIVGSDIATLIDKNLVAEGRPQRLTCTNVCWQVFTIARSTRLRTPFISKRWPTQKYAAESTSVT